MVKSALAPVEWDLALPAFRLCRRAVSLEYAIFSKFPRTTQAGTRGAPAPMAAPVQGLPI